MKKQFKGLGTFLIWFLGLALALLFMLSSCKTPQKTTAETSRNEKKDIARDIALTDDSQIYEAISRGIQTAIDERLDISINKKTYDPDKPADPVTGTPPLVDETNIRLSKKTGTQINDSTKAKKKTNNNSLLTDKTKDKGKISEETKIKEETRTPGWQKTAAGIITVLILSLIIYLARKFKIQKRWKLR